MYSRDLKRAHPIELHHNFYNLKTLEKQVDMKSEFDLRPDKANEHLDTTKMMVEHKKKLLNLSN